LRDDHGPDPTPDGAKLELLGSTAAEVMEEIEDRYPDGEIGAVVVMRTR
jgi:hypothetical protein